jgi:hypothetical protein
MSAIGSGADRPITTENGRTANGRGKAIGTDEWEVDREQ